ncbi:MAG TPA: bifunctional 23S rRNA (guanine(2069)-N(7))-methyltransferase RlmK/23S rRNA (guanine(2445)-N(2))-methyltransferase RlmL [Burkholderiales bacterium]
MSTSVSDSPFRFFAVCAKGIEPLLAEELRALGASHVRETRAGASFAGDLATAYRVCLWSRLASRVLLPLVRFHAPTADALYEGALSIPWGEHLTPETTFAVDAVVADSAVTHSHYAALRVKDAIVDRLRAECGRRPSVDTAQPDVRINLHLRDDEATLGVDLAGESLHRRGYRTQATAAPLKETLAAAVLMRAGWPALAAQGAPLVDPMCGAGTLVLEAALIAADVAPGLLRARFGFERWLGHDAAAWARLRAEAEARRAAGSSRLPLLTGADRDPRAIESARRNLARTGLDPARVRFAVRALGECPELDAPGPGLVATNPPYGERMGEAAALGALYEQLGETLKRCYRGWRAAVLTGNPALGQRLGLRARRLHTLYNGAIECKLLHFEVSEPWYHRERKPVAAPSDLGAGAEMFANRLRKNLRHFGRWAARQGIYAYRVYDADLHEYNVAVDVYECDRRRVHVQEYQAPASIDPRVAARRLREALAVIGLVLDVPESQVYLKVRARQTGRRQYERLAHTGEFYEVREGPCRFLVNFTDYLDTGLFLDHRPVRQMIGALARGRRFLNPVRLHGNGHRARGARRSARERDRGHVVHLSRLGAAQLHAERRRHAAARARPGRRAALARGVPRRAVRSRIPRSAHVLALEAHGRNARRAARSRRADRADDAAARAGGGAPVLDQLPALQAGPGGARRARDRGHHARLDTAGLRAQPAHPPVLPDQPAKRLTAQSPHK